MSDDGKDGEDLPPRKLDPEVHGSTLKIRDKWGRVKTHQVMLHSAAVQCHLPQERYTDNWKIPLAMLTTPTEIINTWCTEHKVRRSYNTSTDQYEKNKLYMGMGPNEKELARLSRFETMNYIGKYLIKWLTSAAESTTGSVSLIDVKTFLIYFIFEVLDPLPVTEPSHESYGKKFEKGKPHDLGYQLIEANPVARGGAEWKYNDPAVPDADALWLTTFICCSYRLAKTQENFNLYQDYVKRIELKMAAAMKATSDTQPPKIGNVSALLFALGDKCHTLLQDKEFKAIMAILDWAALNIGGVYGKMAMGTVIVRADSLSIVSSLAEALSLSGSKNLQNVICWYWTRGASETFGRIASAATEFMRPRSFFLYNVSLTLCEHSAYTARATWELAANVFLGNYLDGSENAGRKTIGDLSVTNYIDAAVWRAYGKGRKHEHVYGVASTIEEEQPNFDDTLKTTLGMLNELVEDKRGNAGAFRFQDVMNKYKELAAKSKTREQEAEERANQKKVDEASGSYMDREESDMFADSAEFVGQLLEDKPEDFKYLQHRELNAMVDMEVLKCQGPFEFFTLFEVVNKLGLHTPTPILEWARNFVKTHRDKPVKPRENSLAHAALNAMEIKFGISK